MPPELLRLTILYRFLCQHLPSIITGTNPKKGTIGKAAATTTTTAATTAATAAATTVATAAAAGLSVVILLWKIIQTTATVPIQMRIRT